MRATLSLALLAACSSSHHPTVGPDAPTSTDAAMPDAPVAGQVLVTTSGSMPQVATINAGTAIGQGAGNGATPATLHYVAVDTNNTETIVSAVNPFSSTGSVPD